MLIFCCQSIYDHQTIVKDTQLGHIYSDLENIIQFNHIYNTLIIQKIYKKTRKIKFSCLLHGCSTPPTPCTSNFLPYLTDFSVIIKFSIKFDLI